MTSHREHLKLAIEYWTDPLWMGIGMVQIKEDGYGDGTLIDKETPAAFIKAYNEYNNANVDAEGFEKMLVLK